MANYVVLAKLTTEGAKSLKEGPQRLSKVNEMMNAAGAKFTAAYATLGEYDYVFVVEGPDDLATVFKMSAATAMMGAHSLQTMPAVPVTDFLKWVSEI
jgi:uncharacterized protein with GYD domain